MSVFFFLLLFRQASLAGDPAFVTRYACIISKLGKTEQKRWIAGWHLC